MKTVTLITALQRLAQCLLIGSLLAFAGSSLATERVTYYHNDALGSPVAATDASGTLLWREEYAPYGERLKKEAGSKDTVWYTGKQEESTFGLNYFGARWYDPKAGRFMGVDPVGFSEDNIHSYSKYAYGNNNPYLYVDPDGNLPIFALAFLAVDFYSNFQDSGSFGEAAFATAIGIVNPLKKIKTVGKLSGKIKFGQGNVKSTFAHGEFKGKSIGEVAQGLRSGKISPDQLPIETVVRNGEKVTLNNRSLTALKRAGLEPTKVTDRTGSRIHERALDRHLGGGQPSDTIRIRGAGRNASSVE